MGLKTVGNYTYCNVATETIVHAFIECVYALFLYGNRFTFG